MPDRHSTLHNCMLSMQLIDKKNTLPFFQVCCKTTNLTHLSRKSRALGSSTAACKHQDLLQKSLELTTGHLFLLRISRKQMRLPGRREAETSFAVCPSHPAAQHSSALQPEAADKPAGAAGGSQQIPAASTEPTCSWRGEAGCLARPCT